MNSISLTCGDITHRKEVTQLLKMAISQKWAFSYASTQGKKVSSVALELADCWLRTKNVSDAGKSPVNVSRT